IGGGLLFLTAPEEEFIPASLTGQLACLVLVTCTGPEEQLRREIGPLLALRPHGQVSMDLPYAVLQSMLDDPRATGTTGPPSTCGNSRTQRWICSAVGRTTWSSPPRRSTHCSRGAVRWPREKVAGRWRTAPPRGWCTRWACGRTPRTTGKPGIGRTICATTCSRTPPVRCT